LARKSFVLYVEYHQHLERLTVEERGNLITAIFDYVRSGALPELGGAEDMAFSFIRAQLDRDAAKYEAICERNRENGAKGGRPKQADPP